MDERQLQWVEHNRRWRPRAESIAGILKRERRRAPLKVPAWRTRVAGVLAEATDGTFADHTWLAGLRSGVLWLNVDDATLLGVLRMQWHRLLVDLLGERLPDLGIVDVRFRLAPIADVGGPRAPGATDGTDGGAVAGSEQG
jgi:hypothetical protein